MHYGSFKQLIGDILKLKDEKKQNSIHTTGDSDSTYSHNLIPQTLQYEQNFER